MRIIECYIENFGTICKQKFTFNDNFNCFIADNGTGKTTLSVFIKAMLYGIGDGRKQDLTENERKRYLPWSGAVASGSLSFVCGGKRYRIERSFGKKPSEDSFALYDLDTGLLSRDFSERAGEEIFEINEGGFERTVFFSERNIPHDTDDGSIAAKLSDLSGVDTDLAGFGVAMDRLEEKRKTLLKRGGGGKIAELKNEISRYEKDIDALLVARERRNALEKEIEEAYLQRDELTGKRNELSEKESGLRNKESKGNKFAFGLRALLLILSAGALIGALTVSPLFYIAMVLTLSLFLISFAAKRKRELSNLSNGISKAYGELKEISEKSIVLETKIAMLLNEREKNEAYIEGFDTLGEDYEKKRADYEDAQNELRYLRLAQDFLEKAKTSITAKYLGKTKTLLSDYVKAIDGHNSATPDMSTDFSLTVLENGSTRIADAYSKGTRTLYSFAARLAFSESLYSGELPFIILDDPFVYFDDPRCKAALSLLLKISKKRQVIYFTASRSRGLDK